MGQRPRIVIFAVPSSRFTTFRSVRPDKGGGEDVARGLAGERIARHECELFAAPVERDLGAVVGAGLYDRVDAVEIIGAVGADDGDKVSRLRIRNVVEGLVHFVAHDGKVRAVREDNYGPILAERRRARIARGTAYEERIERIDVGGGRALYRQVDADGRNGDAYRVDGAL